MPETTEPGQVLTDAELDRVVGGYTTYNLAAAALDYDLWAGYTSVDHPGPGDGFVWDDGGSGAFGFWINRDTWELNANIGTNDGGGGDDGGGGGC